MYTVRRFLFLVALFIVTGLICWWSMKAFLMIAIMLLVSGILAYDDVQYKELCKKNNA